jgi:hypothetical protein
MLDPQGLIPSTAMRLVMGFLRFLEPVPEEYRAAEDDECQYGVTNELVELAEGCSHADENHGDNEQKFDEHFNGRGKLVTHRAPPCVV